MAIVIHCQCGASFRAKDELAGKQVRCPKCQNAIAVPGGPARDPQTPLSMDDMLRLAGAPGETSPTSRGTPAHAPGSPRPSGFVAPSGLPPLQAAPPPGRSPVLMGLAIGGSLLLIAAAVVGGLLMLRATPASVATAPATHAQDASPAEAIAAKSPAEWNA